MRHRRHHPALHQAQLAGAQRQRSGQGAARGVLRRQHRTTRPCPGRCAQGRAVRGRHLSPAAQVRCACVVCAAGEGRRRADPPSGKNWLGMLGMHGTYEANMAMHGCDAMLCVGARFDDRITGRVDAFSPDSKKIHIDIDPSSINKNIRVDIPIIGDAGNVLGDLLQVFKAEAKKPDIRPWWQEIAKWRARNSLSYRKNNDIILPQFAIQRLFEATRGRDVYITTEVGQHQMWAAQFFGFEEPHRWMTSGGLGTMGYGLPAAVGVQVAHRNSLVIDIAGDASVQMTMQEMSTAVQYELPIKIFILNNQYMGMVRQWQQLLHGNRLSHTYSEALPDFVKLADAFGCVGLQAIKPGDLDGANNEMLLPAEANDEATAAAFAGGKALV